MRSEYSQPVAFRATPGEMVSVMTPAQQRDAASGGRTIVNILPNIGADIEARTETQQIGPDEIISVILTDSRAREGIREIAAGPQLRTR